MKYIRTKDGSIWEYDGFKYRKPHTANYLLGNESGIVKASDKIEDLIMNGDFLICDNKWDPYKNYPIIYNGSHLGQWWVKEIYTKQNDNYILVARKENGEWRVI